MSQSMWLLEILPSGLDCGAAVCACPWVGVSTQELMIIAAGEIEQGSRVRNSDSAWRSVSSCPICGGRTCGMAEWAGPGGGE